MMRILKILILLNSEIKFNNINFKYNSDEENVLNNINLNIAGGKNDIISWIQWLWKIDNFKLNT